MYEDEADKVRVVVAWLEALHLSDSRRSSDQELRRQETVHMKLHTETCFALNVLGNVCLLEKKKKKIKVAIFSIFSITSQPPFPSRRLALCALPINLQNQIAIPPITIKPR